MLDWKQVLLALGLVVAAVSAQAVTPQVAVGAWHTLALKSDGTVWSWGDNSHGELGFGTVDTITKRMNPLISTPKQVQGVDHVVAVAAGFRYSLALKEDGTVWAWGANDYGQLGIGTQDTASHPVPQQVSTLSDVSAIVASGSFAVALKSGTVWAWGNNRKLSS